MKVIKMNKHGWGLRVELVIILLFLICLLISAIGLNRLGVLGENENSLLKNNFDYSNLENKLKESAKRYIKEYYGEGITDVVIVRYNTLLNNGYISNLTDKYSKECSGYTEVIKASDTLIYYPYIKCSRYKTEGYEERKDW